MTAHKPVGGVSVMHPESGAPYAMPATSEDDGWLGS
jgi:hypothetical protein